MFHTSNADFPRLKTHLSALEIHFLPYKCSFSTLPTRIFHVKRRPLHVEARLGTVSLSGRGSMPDVLLMGELQGTYQSDNRDNNNYSRINKPAECTGYNTDKTKVVISILMATFSFPCASFCALLLLRFCLRAGSGGRVVSKQNWSQDTENTSVFCPSVLLKPRWNANPELWFHTEAHKTLQIPRLYAWSCDLHVTHQS